MQSGGQGYDGNNGRGGGRGQGPRGGSFNKGGQHDQSRGSNNSNITQVKTTPAGGGHNGGINQFQGAGRGQSRGRGGSQKGKFKEC